MGAEFLSQQGRSSPYFGECLKWMRSFLARDATSSEWQWVAADGGLEVCTDLGINVRAAIGDWDSLERKELLQTCKHLTFGKSKDWCDLSYALDAAEAIDATAVKVFGATLGRADHHLASLFEISNQALALAGTCRFEGHDATASYYFVTPEMGPFLAPAATGSRVSIFAWAGKAFDVQLEGFEYQVLGGHLDPGSHGLSNVVVEADATIQVGSGLLLVVVPHSMESK